jgi:hypothetical protein
VKLVRLVHQFFTVMNFLQRINQVASQDGVEAVFASRQGSEPNFAGGENFRSLAEQAARIHAASPTEMIRINAGTHAIFVSGDDETTVTLIFKKAHPVVKSVKRTMRQLLRKSQRERNMARRVQFEATIQPTARAAGF